jgi:transcriptional regulator with XRE-family HTH domain
VNPAQVRMARAALDWSLEDLAWASSIHRNTISNYETGKYGAHAETLAAIRAALEAAGVEFTNGDQPGVRLKPSKRGQETGNQRRGRAARNVKGGRRAV